MKIINIFMQEKFIKLLSSQEIIDYLNINCKDKSDIILKELENSCQEFHNFNISLDNLKQIIWERYITGLSLQKDLQYSFLEKRKFKTNEGFIEKLLFVPQYKGLLWKARENGYDIKCDYILKCEKDSLRIDMNENSIFFDINDRFLLPIANIPKLKYEDQENIANEIKNYNWQKNDIIGFYVLIKDNKNYKNIRLDCYSLSEIIERTMEIDNYTKTKKIKNKMLNDYLKDNLMMITNAIEALKIRAIRLSCKTLNENLSEITNAIDVSDGYLIRDEFVKKPIIPTTKQTYNNILPKTFIELKNAIEKAKSEKQLFYLKANCKLENLTEDEENILKETFTTMLNELKKQ